MILDSNLLLLYVAGRFRKEAILSIRRLQSFTVVDYDLLDDLVKNARKIILSPNSVTETSNLLHTGTSSRDVVGATNELRILIEKFGEVYLGSKDALADTRVSAIGVADVIMLMLAQTGATLLTADLELWSAARKAGLNSINFNHIRG